MFSPADKKHYQNRDFIQNVYEKSMETVTIIDFHVDPNISTSFHPILIIPICFFFSLFYRLTIVKTFRIVIRFSEFNAGPVFQAVSTSYLREKDFEIVYYEIWQRSSYSRRTELWDARVEAIKPERNSDSRTCVWLRSFLAVKV